MQQDRLRDDSVQHTPHLHVWLVQKWYSKRRARFQLRTINFFIFMEICELLVYIMHTMVPFSITTSKHSLPKGKSSMSASTTLISDKNAVRNRIKFWNRNKNGFPQYDPHYRISQFHFSPHTHIQSNFMLSLWIFVHTFSPLWENSNIIEKTRNSAVDSTPTRRWTCLKYTLLKTKL